MQFLLTQRARVVPCYDNFLRTSAPLCYTPGKFRVLLAALTLRKTVKKNTHVVDGGSQTGPSRQIIMPLDQEYPNGGPQNDPIHA